MVPALPTEGGCREVKGIVMFAKQKQNVCQDFIVFRTYYTSEFFVALRVQADLLNDGHGIALDLNLLFNAYCSPNSA